MNSSDGHILIVGAGPVGLLLGCTLLKAGISVKLVEKRLNRSTLSKALSINAASLKVLHSLGIVNRFLDCGKPISDITVYWNNQRLMHVDYRRLASCYPFILSLPQSETERLLEKYYIALGGEIERGVALIDAVASGTGVNATFSDGSKGDFAYAVGCDGGQSQVRKITGQRFSGHDYGMYFLLFDSKIKWDGFVEGVHYFVKDKGFIIVIPLSNGCHRIVIKIGSKDHAIQNNDILTQKDFQRLVDIYGPGGIKLREITWQSSASFYNRLVSGYRKGKIFLAGDASHLFSPIGGMGMNAGFQDAFNLGWKLAGVLKGELSLDILDTYHEERRHIAKQLIKSTDTTTRLISRIDTNHNGTMRQWLPLMCNRQHMLNTYPMAFAGLSQSYGKSKINQGDSQLVGSQLAYATFFVGEKLYSTYDLNDGIHATILAVNQQSNIIQTWLKSYPIKLLLLTEEQCQRLITQGVPLKCEEAIFIRPDGYVGWHGQIKDKAEIQTYLNSLFIQKTGALRHAS